MRGTRQLKKHPLVLKPRRKKPRGPKPSVRTVPRLEQEEAVVDEYGAGGGMPVAPRPSPSTSVHRPMEVSWSEFERQVRQLGQAVQRRFHPDVVVGLAHGGVYVGQALAAALKVDFFPVHLSRRSRDRASHAPEGIDETLPKALKNRRVLLVDDVASSGDSLELAVRLAKSRGAKAWATAALVARPGRFSPTFSATTTQRFLIFPWDYQSLVDEARFGPKSR